MIMVEFDLVVHGGQVIDGNGTRGRAADVAVQGGIIFDVGRVAGERCSAKLSRPMLTA